MTHLILWSTLLTLLALKCCFLFFRFRWCWWWDAPRWWWLVHVCCCCWWWCACALTSVSGWARCVPELYESVWFWSFRSSTDQCGWPKFFWNKQSRWSIAPGSTTTRPRSLTPSVPSNKVYSIVGGLVTVIIQKKKKEANKQIRYIGVN